MKKGLFLCIVWSCLFVTACVSTNGQSSGETTIIMELEENYDDVEPFVNERLFCVLEDVESLTVDGVLTLEGESGLLEVQDAKTNEVLWSHSWEESVSEEPFTISLEQLQKEKEYVLSFIGTGIVYATVEVTVKGDIVQELERPSVV